MEEAQSVTSSAEEALQLERNLALQALRSGDKELAWNRMFDLLKRMPSASRSANTDALFVATTLDMSDLSFVLGRGFGDLVMFLQDALTPADRLGDRRSRALIKLHLGRLYYFAERRHEAVALFLEAKDEVERLGDEDILTRSAEFLGLHFFIQGMFPEAMVYLQRALESFEARDSHQVINPSAPIWLAYCAAYMGEFHRAIGILDYYRRSALEQGDRSLASTIRAVLGIVLLLVKKNQEAAHHLSGALQEATRSQNALALYFARGALAYHHCLEGRLGQTRDLLVQAIGEGAAAGLVRQYASPMVLEMLYEIQKSGLPPVPGLSFTRETLRLLKEPNIHLRGVALRLRAMDKIDRSGDLEEIIADLEASQDCLARAGTPVQLAKTRIEMARVMLHLGKSDTARQLAQKAWMALSGYGEGFYPDDLRHLLAIRGRGEHLFEFKEEFLDRFTEIIQELVPSGDLDKLLAGTVASTNRFLGAERGGIFWFSRGNRNKAPILRASRNLTAGEVTSEEFQGNLALVKRAFRKNTPQVMSPLHSRARPTHVRAILCIPFDVEGRTRGVLYHDNSYLDGGFDFLDKSQLLQMSRYLSAYIGQIHEYSRRLERQVSDKAFNWDRPYDFDIVADSSVMKRMLAQADQIAASEGAVLILGETGVGKELLARRIHGKSHRNEKPLIVVDPTTIPENLVESELFGHEKGAFTGADRQKKGRMELAHQGTLFIDEVGEIPKSIQVKLLRVLQEKTMVRIGGTKNISCDFRLITATNRDLAEEVAVGRFREDLFYRLNVVPIYVPPLRERKEDIPVLAHHFLARYASKYNHPKLRLSLQDEERLQAYDWPGNVRELQNIVERAVLLSRDEQIEIEAPSGKSSLSSHPFSDMPTLDELQRRYISYVLDKTGGKIGGADGAADILGMKRSSLYTRMEKLGLR